jgi:hypothetical protein
LKKKKSGQIWVIFAVKSDQNSLFSKKNEANFVVKFNQFPNFLKTKYHSNQNGHFLT